MFYILFYIFFLIIVLFTFIMDRLIDVDFSISQSLNSAEHIFTKEQHIEKKQYVKDYVRKNIKISKILISDKKLDYLIEKYKEI